MIVTTTFESTRTSRDRTTVLVPTMGSLHQGHISLIRLARGLGDSVVVSLFVNPLQFDRESDLARYPRDFDRDAAICEAEGVDALFAPPVEEMYPGEPDTTVSVDRVSRVMEGEHRPGHFVGVATVVTKLFGGIQPDVAVFGRKDAQQLAVVRTLASDLRLPVRIVGAPTIREADGLALSSRNVFLDGASRPLALGLSRGLMDAADLVEAGETGRDHLIDAVRRRLEMPSVDYVELADQERAQPLVRLDRPAFLAVAAWVGEVRLIDNVAFDPVAGDASSGPARFVADRGVRLSDDRVSG